MPIPCRVVKTLVELDVEPPRTQPVPQRDYRLRDYHVLDAPRSKQEHRVRLRLSLAGNPHLEVHEGGVHKPDIVSRGIYHKWVAGRPIA
jgi:hypothetical protein